MKNGNDLLPQCMSLLRFPSYRSIEDSPNLYFYELNSGMMLLDFSVGMHCKASETDNSTCKNTKHVTVCICCYNVCTLHTIFKSKSEP